MYEFARGPLVWVAFIIFFAGIAYKLWQMLAGAKKEKVIYPYMSLKFGLRSIVHWVVPFATRSWRIHPGMTLATFGFHICLLATPVFLMAHNVLWFESWGVRLPSLPEQVADVMTLVVIFAGLFFLARRLFVPVVAYVTHWSDYLVLLIAIGPFVSGFLATHEWFAYETMLVIHIFSGALWLAAIPFTRLSHMLYAVFTRAYMGSEFGAVRNARDW